MAKIAHDGYEGVPLRSDILQGGLDDALSARGLAAASRAAHGPALSAPVGSLALRRAVDEAFARRPPVQLRSPPPLILRVHMLGAV